MSQVMIVRSRILTTEGEMRLIDDPAAVPRFPEYVDGAIELVVGGVHVLGLRHWDVVDQLWAYIATALGNMLSSGHGSTLFPDQPIELSFTRESNEVVVGLRVPGEPPVLARADGASLLRALCAEGIHFSERLIQLVPTHDVGYAVMRGTFVELGRGRVPRLVTGEQLVVDFVQRQAPDSDPVVVFKPPPPVVGTGTRLVHASGHEMLVLGVDLPTLRGLDDDRLALVVSPDDEGVLVAGSSWSVVPEEPAEDEIVIEL